MVSTSCPPSSAYRFDNILSLVHHYSSTGPLELPVVLALPEVVRQTEGRSHISAMARLGQGEGSRRRRGEQVQEKKEYSKSWLERGGKEGYQVAQDGAMMRVD